MDGTRVNRTLHAREQGPERNCCRQNLREVGSAAPSSTYNKLGRHSRRLGWLVKRMAQPMFVEILYIRSIDLGRSSEEVPRRPLWTRDGEGEAEGDRSSLTGGMGRVGFMATENGLARPDPVTDQSKIAE